MNIRITLGSLRVSNTIFTDGRASHINAERTNVILDSVTVRDSEDFVSEGHGLYCDTCTVRVTNSSFINLKAFKAPAIYIKNCGSTTEQSTHLHLQEYMQLIETSIFEDNHALGSFGAIKLENAGSVLIKQNKFNRNTVSDSQEPLIDWIYCDAGAIYFECGDQASVDPDHDCKTVLDSNVFQDNFAKNKGGALRYIHKNFTTVYEAKSNGRRFLSDRFLQSSESDEMGDMIDTNTY